jgi:glycosyltransferase involved in cell wall biosynthesis
MRIVHFTGTFLPNVGGAEAVVHNLALAQTRMGHEVYVLNTWGRRKNTIRRYLPYRLLSLPPKYQPNELFKRPLRRMVLRAWLMYLQRCFRFDAWHLHFAYPIGSALPLLQGMGIEPVLTCHGDDVQTEPSVGFGMRLDPEIDQEVTRVLRRCKKLVGISSDIRKEFLRTGCAAHRVFDVPNGVSLDRIGSISRPVAVESIRRRYGIRREASIILTVGRNHPIKRYDLIPTIIALLAGAGKDFTWVLVGPGCEPLSEALAARGLTGYLRTVGRVGPCTAHATGVFSFPSDEVVAFLKAADVFAFPTRMEGLPLVVLEAMAAGLPVVSTAVPGVRDLAEDGVNGFLTPEGDAQQMAGYLGTLLSNPQLREEMGARGQQKAAQYDWPLVARRYVDLYCLPCS